MEKSKPRPGKVGRKPLEDKKIAVSIYRPKSHYKALGGMETAREILNRAMDRAVNQVTKSKTK